MNHRSILPFVAVAGLTACGTVRKYEVYDPANESSVVGDLTEGTVGSVAIDSVFPPFGSTAGGSEIVVRGGPFDRFTEVWFGDEEGSVISADEGELRVVVPEVPVEGEVVLTVRSEGTEAASTFRYWEDASGLVGLKGTLSFFDVVGDYWAEGALDRAFAEIALVEPVAFESWEDFAPHFNGCSSDWGTPAEETLDAGQQITLVSASTTLDLASEGDGWYAGDEGITPGQSYGLEPSGDWSGLSVDAMVEVPVGLRIQAPALEGAAPPKVGRQFDLEWDRTTPADYVAIVLERASFANGTWTVKQKVSCAVSDTGSFTVPGGLWDDWVEDEFVLVSIGRVRESDWILPHNNARSAVTGVYWVAGAVRAR